MRQGELSILLCIPYRREQVEHPSMRIDNSITIWLDKGEPVPKNTFELPLSTTVIQQATTIRVVTSGWEVTWLKDRKGRKPGALV